MATPTPAEQTAYAHMQARLVALLLQYDQRGFQRFFDQRVDAADEEAAPTRPYRDLGVLFFLGGMLFEDILPRIVRRLSFESPRSIVVEEPPVRGRIHWERTLDAAWDERPGDPPLLLHTRQRRRDFATSENLLTVATLIEYEAALRGVLRGDRALIGAQALRHPLNDLADRCGRELAFPQFAGLTAQARRVLDGADGGISALEARVAGHVAPGGNRAYDDLLAWRARWRMLQLLRRAPEEPAHDVLGADPQRDNYLYQLWIFYELADLLQRAGRLVTIESRPGRMALRFTWGEGPAECTYLLRHDQGMPEPVSQWNAQPNPKDIPGVRPDFSILRVDPPITRVFDKNTLIWREPGAIWDAKYYRERESERTPSSPIKRMIADLALLSEPYGALLFAFLAGAGDPTAERRVDACGPQRLTPVTGADWSIAAQEVVIHQLRPVLDDNQPGPQHLLHTLLDDMHDRLARPRIPACHGIFLDTLSAKDQGALVDRTGAALPQEAEDLLICTKPHIGPWRVDLVSRARHCCKDARFCHIVGQFDAQPPLRPPRTAEELLRELAQITAGDHGVDVLGERASIIAQQIEQLTRRLATELGVFRRIEVYFHRVRDIGMGELFEQLAAAERESLALAVFLVEQLDTIGANDYSAPAIHLSSVVEIEIKRRVFACPNLVGELANHKKQTLGVLPYLRQNPDAGDGNWPIIQRYVADHWHEQLDPDDPDVRVTFDELIARAINRISQVRNTAAHTNPLPRKDYTDLQTLVFQGGRLPCGVLKTLLLAWRRME